MGEKPGRTMVERLGVPTMVTLWYLCSIIGNNAGKEVLPLFPYPFTLSLMQFFIGASSVPLYLLVRGRPVGHLVLLVRHFFHRALLLGFTGIGSNLLHRLALLYITVSFEHTVKATQPLWSAALSAVLLHQQFSWQTLFTLFIITVGVALSAFNEFQFHWLGFFAAMGSAFSMSVANTYQKRFMAKSHTSPHGAGPATSAHELSRQGTSNAITSSGSAPSAAKFSANDLFFVTNACSFALMAPLWWYFDGWRLFGSGAVISGAAGAEGASPGLGNANNIPPLKVVVLALLNTVPMVLQHFVSISLLAMVSPVTHSIVNSGKRIVVIVLSIMYFRNPVSTLNVCGMCIAVLGVFLYNRALSADKEIFASSPVNSPRHMRRKTPITNLDGVTKLGNEDSSEDEGCDDLEMGGLDNGLSTSAVEMEEAYAGTEAGRASLHSNNNNSSSSSSTAHHRLPPYNSSIMAKGP